MLKVFVGYDPRQPLAYNVLQHSLVRNSSAPVAITPLILRQLPINRRGLTEFTYSRFLVPYLCNYEGVALFLDPDMVVTGDISELFAYADESAVQVVKDQAKFEWPSLMLFNNSKCRELTPDRIDSQYNPYEFNWGDVGELPKEWNLCVGYEEPQEANLYHYTQGLPCWFETKDCFASDVWQEEYKALTKTCEWKDLMGTSVHAKPVLRKMLQRYVDNA